jgi:hypothetical protein
VIARLVLSRTLLRGLLIRSIRVVLEVVLAFETDSNLQIFCLFVVLMLNFLELDAHDILLCRQRLIVFAFLYHKNSPKGSLAESPDNLKVIYRPAGRSKCLPLVDGVAVVVLVVGGKRELGLPLSEGRLFVEFFHFSHLLAEQTY